ncbi:MAG: hypothetical protein KDI90_12085 [Alphaproteobacteria bacterium]|nr:hypothetical protein [Alphaproteobacteria bacterium]MCB9974153.1 hypothetical protein [Rhodospirillales bacterium]
MREFVNLLPIFVLVLSLSIASISYAYDPADVKDKVVVELINDQKSCKDIYVSFPKKLPSCEKMPDPYVKFEVRKKDEIILKANLLAEVSGRENYSRAHFCLPEEFISEAILTIFYEGAVGAVQREDGSMLFSVPFCNHTIVIDNLDELIAKNK